jgi:hypothetical protein
MKEELALKPVIDGRCIHNHRKKDTTIPNTTTTVTTTFGNVCTATQNQRINHADYMTRNNNLSVTALQHRSSHQTSVFRWTTSVSEVRRLCLLR